MFEPYRRRLRPLVIWALCTAFLSLPSTSQQDKPESLPPNELTKKVQDLEQQMEALRAEVARLRQQSVDQAALDELSRRIEIMAEELERLRLTTAAGEEIVEGSRYGLGVAASKVYGKERGVSIGGYGELLYQHFDSERDNGSSANKSDQIDFLRAIVYFGYKFNDHWVFNSEVEFEHASTEEDGAVSVEFATLDYLWRPELNARVGLLLVPMGFLNELHEPPLFLGTLRPQVERRLLPSTWRENGLGLFGEAGSLRYRSYLLSGLDASGFSAAGLRGGRQNGSESTAESFAWVTRLDWTPTPGLLLGGSIYLGDSGQGLEGPAGRELDVGTTLFEAHAEWKVRGLEARALYARGKLDDITELNQALGLAGSASVGEELEGYYLQLGYDLLSRVDSGERQLIPYLRWETLDSQKKVPMGFASDREQDIDILTLGLAWKPLDELVFKIDYQDTDNEAGSGLDQLNVGVGYLF